MRIEIPGLALPSLTNQREHWSKRHKRHKAQRQAVALLWRTTPGAIGPLAEDEHVTVRITRIAPREVDDDNVRGACKATRDEIARCLGVDDRDPRVTWDYGQERGPVAVRIEVVREA